MIDGKAPAVEFLRMLGKTPIALLITLHVCIAAFAKDYGMARLENCVVIRLPHLRGDFSHRCGRHVRWRTARERHW